jgi:hypothetical protein
MTRMSRSLCGALVTLLSACGDAGGAATTTAAQTGSSGEAASSGGPGGSPTAPNPTEDADSGGNSNSNSNGESSSGGPNPTTTPNPSTDPDTTSPATSAPGTTGPDPGTTAGDDTTTTTTGTEDGVVRFVVLGDTGEGNEGQYAVAQAIVEVCAQKGCDFGMLTGDNFYDDGVDGVDDPQWQDKFELPYEDIDFPIYAVLGNHDYGGDGLGVDLFEPDAPDYQVQYTQMSERWRMPDFYYDFELEHAHFWGLDTNQVMTDPLNGDADTQQDWLVAGLAASTATWKIAFGHHPYISNGDHGNAGSYENIEGFNLPFVTGESVKEFMEEAVCGKVDVYICGHDHNIQWLEPTCGTEFIVSGAGSKSEGLPGSNPAFFGMPETEGFLWVEIADDTFTGEFYDSAGALLYTRSFAK